MSWFDTARFANWMANGQPTGPQTAATTENGAYALNGITTGTAPAKNLINPNTGAAPAFYIPLENEWYKAAYYSPLLNAGAGGYYAYATQSDSPPGNAIGSTPNQANFRARRGIFSHAFSVTQSTAYDTNQNYLTDVGAFSSSSSYYGTFAQSGNLVQWNDLNGSASAPRGRRGGMWNDTFVTYLSSAVSSPNDAWSEDGADAIRLAAVLEREPLGLVVGGRGVRQEVVDAVDHRRRVGWLRDVGIGSVAKPCQDIARLGERREQEHGRGPQIAVSLDGPAELVTVHLRHLDVEDDKIGAVAAGDADRLGARVAPMHDVASRLERSLEHQPLGAAVLGHDDLSRFVHGKHPTARRPSASRRRRSCRRNPRWSADVFRTNAQAADRAVPAGHPCGFLSRNAPRSHLGLWVSITGGSSMPGFARRRNEVGEAVERFEWRDVDDALPSRQTEPLQH